MLVFYMLRLLKSLTLGKHYIDMIRYLFGIFLKHLTYCSFTVLLCVLTWKLSVVRFIIRGFKTLQSCSFELNKKTTLGFTMGRSFHCKIHQIRVQNITVFSAQNSVLETWLRNYILYSRRACHQFLKEI